MSNRLYDLGRQKFLEGSIHWLTDNIQCVLVDLDDYSPDFLTDEFLSAIPVGAIIATSGNFSGKDSTFGVANASNVLLNTVTGHEFEAIVIYKWVTNAADSPLIGFIDTATGLPTTPSGGDQLIIWDTGVNKIFKL